VWDTTRGPRLLSNVLAALGVDVSGWDLRTVTSVSADGKVVVGGGIAPNGISRSFIARLP
jgi:hypothetical protein